MVKNIFKWMKRWVFQIWKSTRSTISSPTARKYQAWVFQAYMLAAILGFSALALLANLTDYLQIDILATQELQKELPVWMTGVMVAISWPGYPVQGLAIILIIFLILTLLGLRWEAVSSIVAALSSIMVNYLAKIAIQRPRPSEDLVDVFTTINNYSFPSGHVMFYTTYFGFLLFLTFVFYKNSIRRNLLILLFLLLILAVGLSRMYLGEHWASDVVGGYLLGSLTLIFSIKAYQWGKENLSKKQPVAAERNNE